MALLFSECDFLRWPFALSREAFNRRKALRHVSLSHGARDLQAKRGGGAGMLMSKARRGFFSDLLEERDRSERLGQQAGRRWVIFRIWRHSPAKGADDAPNDP